MLFLDSVDLTEVRRWHSCGVIRGVTTNPTIVRKQGIIDVEAQLALIAEVVAPSPIAVEVTLNAGEDTLAAARRLHGIAPNVMIKVPVVTADGTPGLPVIHQLHQEGVPVNATACFTLGQTYLAAQAGADHVTVFWSRILEEGAEAADVVSSARTLVERDGLATRILVGSLRRADDIGRALLAGAHIATVPPALLSRWVDHYFARETVAQFDRDERERISLVTTTGPR